ncbi:MAG: ABC transporter permease [Dehalococcoidia bacterium]
MSRLSARLGGVRNALFLLAVLGLGLILLADILLVDHILDPWGYFNLFFIITALLYGVYPLFVNRRLTRYYWERTRRNRIAILGLAFIAFLTLVALVGPLFIPDPTRGNIGEEDMPPLGISYEQSFYDADSGRIVSQVVTGTWARPLGTDDRGRDLLAMLISGARISLRVGLQAILVSISIGVIIGLVSAYRGGVVDQVLMRFTDIMMTFPTFILLVLVVSIFDANLNLIILFIGIFGWTGAARMVRSEALSLRTRDFITASRSLGASDSRIIFRHLMPNVMSIIIVMMTLGIPSVILAEAALSFIGLGDPTVASWGQILKAGQESLDTTWWVAVEPGIMLFLTVLAFNFFGDGLRDAFDPRSQV